MNHDSTPYPGYKFRRSSPAECLYVSDDEQRQIIEVHGVAKVIDTPEGPRWRTSTVAILQGDDAPLYEMLQWKNYWRWHTAVQMGNLFIGISIWVALVICHIAAWRFWFFETNAVVVFLVIIALPLLEMLIGFKLWRFARTCYGIASVCKKVRANIRKNGMTRTYYRDLFAKLSKANARDKAEAAKIIAKFI